MRGEPADRVLLIHADHVVKMARAAAYRPASATAPADGFAFEHALRHGKLTPAGTTRDDGEER
jgi:hypothetical protein